MESSVKPTVMLTAGQGVAFAVTLFIPVVLARIFTPADFGAYKQLFLVYGTLANVLPFGLAESLFYFLPGRAQSPGRYVANSMLALTATGLVGLAAVQLAGPQISGAFRNPELQRQSGLLGVFLLLMMVAAVLEITMVARGRFVTAAATYAGSDLLRGACLLIPAALVGSVEALMLGAVAFGLVRVAAAITYAAALPGGLRPERSLFREQLAYALPFGLAVVLEIVQRNLTQYVVSIHFEPATFAVYSVGLLQIPLIDALWASAGNVLMVRLVTFQRSGETDKALQLWLDMTRRMGLLMLGTVAFLEVVAGDLIVVLFTPTYAASVPIFRVACLAMLLGALMTDAVLRVHAQTRFLTVVNAVRLAVTVIALFVLLPSLQLPGAVLASLLAFAAGKVVSLARLRTLLGVGVSGLVPWRPLAITAVAATAAGALTSLSVIELMSTPLTRLAASVLVFWLIYGVLAVVILPPGDRSALVAWLRRWTGGLAQEKPRSTPVVGR